ncbi:MAG: DUF983 domain-containing protein [bacterium]|nr:DUF983 domain-containing protein [bacterium]
MLIEDKPTGFHRFGRILQLKCPKCGKAKVFYSAKYPGVRPRMKDTCDNCGYQFHKEEEHYHRVVYLSYGLTILEGLLTFLLGKYMVFGMSSRDLFLASLAVMLFLSIWNYKIARVIWMNVFPGQAVK